MHCQLWLLCFFSFGYDDASQAVSEATEREQQVTAKVLGRRGEPESNLHDMAGRLRRRSSHFGTCAPKKRDVSNNLADPIRHLSPPSPSSRFGLHTMRSLAAAEEYR